LERLPNGAVRTRALRQFTNLISGQYTAYALFTKRTVGDQPGSETPRYLDGGWKRLPEGMFFATNKFIDLGTAWTNALNLVTDPTNRVLPYAAFPFPTADVPRDKWMRLPYIAFDPSGRLTYETQARLVGLDGGVTLSRGSVFYPKDNQGQFLLEGEPDIVATPRTNRTDVVVNWITGRPRILEAKVQ
jgi:hypothetical protein